MQPVRSGQEVQRILCAGFGPRLLERAGLDSRAPGMVDTAALAVADTRRNAASVSRTGVDAALSAWHDTYVQVAGVYWRSRSTAHRDALARSWLRDEVQRRELHLSWVLTGERPAYCYGLNLFTSRFSATNFWHPTARTQSTPRPARRVLKSVSDSRFFGPNHSPDRGDDARCNHR